MSHIKPYLTPSKWQIQLWFKENKVNLHWLNNSKDYVTNDKASKAPKSLTKRNISCTMTKKGNLVQKILFAHLFPFFFNPFSLSSGRLVCSRWYSWPSFQLYLHCNSLSPPHFLNNCNHAFPIIWNFHNSVFKDAISFMNLIKRELKIKGFLHLLELKMFTPLILDTVVIIFFNLVHFCSFAF